MSQSDCVICWKVDFIWQLVTTSSVAEPRRSSKTLSKAKFAPEKCHGHWLVVCCLSDPLQLSESQQNHYIWEYAQQTDDTYWRLQCLQLALVNRKDPILLHNNIQPHVTQPTLQKLNELGYKVMPHLPYSPDLLPTNYHFFKQYNFFMECFHNQQEAENAFQESIESWSMDFYTMGINELISHWQKCVDCNRSYFDE